MIQETGNLIDKALNLEFDVIIHGCNCQCTMGAGIAKTIRQKFPEAYTADLQTTAGDRAKLGTISYAEVWMDQKKLTVVNAYTQFEWRGPGIKVDYGAVRSAFQLIKKQFTGMRMGYPKIGAGLAGGDWQVISQIIDEELAGENHVYVAFE
jgi:O-acetyl-ADP-ribose deacetylase (regulator of RNase III)